MGEGDILKGFEYHISKIPAAKEHGTQVSV
jgi:hypothetical protein